MKCAFNVVLFVLVSAWSALSAEVVPGTWAGTINIARRELHAELEIQGSGPAAKAIINLVEARLDDFPLPVFTIEGANVHFEVPPGWGLAMFRDIGLRAEEQSIVFDGTLDRTGEIDGRLTIAGATVPLRLARRVTDDTSSAYTTEDVGFDNGEVHIAGTLLLPRSGPRHRGRSTAIVFVHGSGSRTRIAHRFEAEALARAGIAALIYDKRGAGRSSGGNFQVATLDELTSDAEAAVAYLETRREIDPRRIGVYGLSQGSWIGAKLAARSKRLGFLVSVSGSGISLWEQELYRARAMMQLYGYSATDVEAAQAFIRDRFDVSRTGLGWDRLQARMKDLEAQRSRWFKDFGDGPSSLVSARFWWLAFFSYNPRNDLGRTRLPVLGFFGGRDRTVPPADAEAAMKESLRPNPRTHFYRIEAAEHSMMSPVTVDGRPCLQLISSEYLDHLTTWVVEMANSGGATGRSLDAR